MSDTRLHVKVWNNETNRWDEHGAYETWSEANAAMHELMHAGKAVSVEQGHQAPIILDRNATGGKSVEWNPEWLASPDGKDEP